MCSGGGGGGEGYGEFESNKIEPSCMIRKLCQKLLSRLTPKMLDAKIICLMLEMDKNLLSSSTTPSINEFNFFTNLCPYFVLLYFLDLFPFCVSMPL